MLGIQLEKYRIRVGASFALSFQRTLRVPDDGRSYPLPPDLGPVELSPVRSYRDRVPAHWADEDILMPLYQREAVWLALHGKPDKPHAVQVGIGYVNAVSGTSWEEPLCRNPQNYLVSPPQPWLDGINVGEARIRQFVAMPLGLDYTIEKQLTGTEVAGGIQVRVYALKPDRLPQQLPPDALRGMESLELIAEDAQMGLAAGGAIEQRIYPDPFEPEDWDMDNFGAVSIHIINSHQYRGITGKPPPPPQIDARTYTENGLPWFRLYDEEYGDIAAPPSLAQIQSVRVIDAERQTPPDKAEVQLSIERQQIRSITPKPTYTKREENVMSQLQKQTIDPRKIVSELPNLETISDSLNSALRREVRQRSIIIRDEIDAVEESLELPDETQRVLEAGARAAEKIRSDGPDAPLSEDEQLGLEAVINAVGRPAILIKDNNFVTPPDPWQILETDRSTIQRRIPSIGRIERVSQGVAREVATGFLVGEDVVMTNHHVVNAIADPTPPGSGLPPFQLRSSRHPQINFIAESGATRTLTFPIEEVIAVHPTLDLGLLRIGRQSLSTPGATLPPPLRLASKPPDITDPKNVYVIGYPATDNEGVTPGEVMRRIFADIFEVKRLQPGNLTNTFDSVNQFAHDCSTLGGNSGSGVIDLDTGLVIGLHFSGSYLRSNFAVALWKLTQDPILTDAQVQFD